MRLFRHSSEASAEDHTGAGPSNLILSFPKSGRTWLAYLYAYYACYRAVGDQADEFIDREVSPTAHVYRPLEHPALIAKLQDGNHPVLPPLRLGHHFEAKPYFQLDLMLSKVEGDRVAFLVRDPRDVVVSYFHHTMGRAEEGRKRGKTAPAPDVDLSEFIRSELHGIRAIVTYMNQVIERGPRTFPVFRMVHYEELVSAPGETFKQVLECFGADIDQKGVEFAVARASFENLQRLEIQQRTTKKGGAPPSAEALRFRRGVPGGYRRELTEADVAYLDKVIQGHLDPIFERYRRRSN